MSTLYLADLRLATPREPLNYRASREPIVKDHPEWSLPEADAVYEALLVMAFTPVKSSHLSRKFAGLYRQKRNIQTKKILTTNRYCREEKLESLH